MKYLRLLRCVFLLVVVFSCKNKSTSKAIKNTKPNILFIFPDQFRNAAIGINNQDPVITPNLDKLGKEGMVISNAISNYPLCSPYRGMLMTGLLPYNNNVLSNSNSKRHKYNNSWQKDDVSISDVLVKNGYDAGYVGKLHLTSPPPIKGKDTVLWDAYQPKELRHGFKFWYAYGAFDQHNNPHYWINEAKEDEVTQIYEWSAKHEADVIIDYIKNPSAKTRSADKPFALFWSVNPPHPPYQFVPEKYVEVYKDKSLDELLIRENLALDSDAAEFKFHAGATRERTHLAKEHVKNHFAMVTGVDEQIGRVLKALKDKGLEENTIVIITSDHGEMMGSHGLMSKNIWFEEAINVPFIIKWPKKIKTNQKSDLILSVTDIMPTILNLAAATEGIPTGLDGKDLSTIITHDKGDKPTSALYYYIEEGKPASGHRGIRTHKNTYVITIDKKNIERKFLYDNVNDPYQKINLIDKDIDAKEILHAELLKNLNDKKDPWLEKYQNLNQR